MSEYAFTTPQCHIEAYIKEIPPNYPIAQWAIDIGIFNPETDAWLVSITVGNVTNAINLRKSGIGSKVLDDFESTYSDSHFRKPYDAFKKIFHKKNIIN
ncbi:MAG: hypothetical protein UT34_C0002G0344 [candidate division WS6 bacterium GW2011_GWF2_39_15]|uniref:Uncharacterized protein n=1 Tax=candidate division WS6 bacterium GW2011_GWF2_39_15 TaxID=1619100 RepID=A0A0G0QW23_9BACT|nr:MAG: hypothetical protein UT34_C0002G0344 [candidate division WS6 bacterium GW2011_GWF2_39_15]